MFSCVHRTSEDVNIYQLPHDKSLNVLPQGAELTIGDLHGNFIKLLYSLIEQGIAYNISVEEYEYLVNLYKLSLHHNDKVTGAHLEKFNLITNKLKFHNHALVRLIGDETADRGANDYFTLRLLKKLKDEEVPTEILLSNHGFEFIHAYETSPDGFKLTRNFGSQFHSVFRMSQFVSRGLVEANEVRDIIETVYKPSLKILSYTLNTAKNEITLYSHAGVGLETIKDLAIKFGVSYNDKTCADLAATIDEINRKFASVVAMNKVNDLSRGAECPVSNIMWNRSYYNLKRPKLHNGYRVNYIHGHDRNDLTKDHIYTLDNLLGHAQIPDNHIGRQLHHISNPHLREPQQLLSESNDIEMTADESVRNKALINTQISTREYKADNHVAILDKLNGWQLRILSQSGKVFFFGNPADNNYLKMTLEDFDKPLLANILTLPRNGGLISKIKSQFLIDLKHKLTTDKLSRTDILNMFEQLKDRDGVYKIIHHQRHSGWDAFRSLFKFGCNRAPGENKIWQTATYQKAIKLLKNAYLNIEGNVEAGHAEREQAFIDYRRGNAPVTFGETETRKLISKRTHSAS